MNTPPLLRHPVLNPRCHALGQRMFSVTLARAGPTRYGTLWGICQGPGAPPGWLTG